MSIFEGRLYDNVNYGGTDLSDAKLAWNRVYRNFNSYLKNDVEIGKMDFEESIKRELKSVGELFRKYKVQFAKARPDLDHNFSRPILNYLKNLN